MLNSARATQALSHIKVVDNGVAGYYSDYNSINFSPSAVFTANRDKAGSTCRVSSPSTQHEAFGSGGGDQMIRALMGYHTASRTWGQASNYRRKRYISIPDVKNMKGGLTWASFNEPHGIVDPWGQPYFLAWDLDYNGEISVSNLVGGSSYQERVKVGGTYFAMYSGGPDQSVFTPSDDVTSW